MEPIRQEDSFRYIISSLREGADFSAYGYEVYVREVVRSFLASERGVEPRQLDRLQQEHSPPFLAAAWELSRRGILRPGIKRLGAQATDRGSSGVGFSVTPFGATWLREASSDEYVPTEPERFAEMISPYKTRYGPGFHERSQEAIRCYGAHAYLACCAMCGAASESVLLAAAIAKEGDEEAVLKAYSSSGGRGRVEKKVLGQAKNWIKREFSAFTTLLKYWRDEAAHGRKSGIDDNEAYTSVALLLRFAQFADQHWDEIVS